MLHWKHTVPSGLSIYPGAQEAQTLELEELITLQLGIGLFWQREEVELVN